MGFWGWIARAVVKVWNAVKTVVKCVQEIIWSTIKILGFIGRVVLAGAVLAVGFVASTVVTPFSSKIASEIERWSFKTAACILGYCDVKQLERDKIRQQATEENERGENAFKRHDFEAALNAFKRAATITDKEDPNLPTYKMNIERAKAALAHKQGKTLFTQNRLEESIEKFQEAIRILSPYSSHSHINNELNSYKADLANLFNELGNRYFRNQNYDKAREMYQKAVTACPPGISRLNDYKNNLTRAQNAIHNRNAENYDRQGWDAFNRGDYITAENLFQKAYNEATWDYINKPQFEQNRKRAKAEVYSQEGKKLFALKNYTAARDQFQKAYDESPAAFKQPFLNSLNKAKAEVFNEEGLSLSSQGLFQQSIQKFNDALKILPNTELARHIAIKDNLANTHNSYAEQLMTEENLHEALNQINLAIKNVSQNNPNREKFRKKKILIEWDIYYNEIKELLDDAESSDSTVTQKLQFYEDAIARLSKAFDEMPEERKIKINELRRLRARAHEGYGDLVASKQNYQQAKVQFMKALEYADDDGLRMKLEGKITDAQLNFFRVEYKSLTDEIDELSAECAIENVVNLLEGYKETVERTQTDELYDKLINLTRTLIERRSISQAEKAAEIGKKYFSDKSMEFDSIINEAKKQRENPKHLRNKIKAVEDEKILRQGLGVKYISS